MGFASLGFDPAALEAALPTVKISSPYVSGSLSLRSVFANPPVQGVPSGPQNTDAGVSVAHSPAGLMSLLRKPAVLIGAAVVALVLVWHFFLRK